MDATPHFGIRCMEDLRGKYSDFIIDSVDLLNVQLAACEMSFYFDGDDFRQQMIGGKHCGDMFGWVVPNDAVNDFEPIWLAGWRGREAGRLRLCLCELGGSQRPAACSH